MTTPYRLVRVRVEGTIRVSEEQSTWWKESKGSGYVFDDEVTNMVRRSFMYTLIGGEWGRELDWDPRITASIIEE